MNLMSYKATNRMLAISVSVYKYSTHSKGEWWLHNVPRCTLRATYRLFIVYKHISASGGPQLHNAINGCFWFLISGFWLLVACFWLNLHWNTSKHSNSSTFHTFHLLKRHQTVPPPHNIWAEITLAYLLWQLLAIAYTDKSTWSYLILFLISLRGSCGSSIANNGTM